MLDSRGGIFGDVPPAIRQRADQMHHADAVPLLGRHWQEAVRVVAPNVAVAEKTPVT